MFTCVLYLCCYLHFRRAEDIIAIRCDNSLFINFGSMFIVKIWSICIDVWFVFYLLLIRMDMGKATNEKIGKNSSEEASKRFCLLGSNVVGKLWTACNVQSNISRTQPFCWVMCCVFLFLFLFSFSSFSLSSFRFSYGCARVLHTYSMDNIGGTGCMRLYLVLLTYYLRFDDSFGIVDC